ncbi:MAG TPA: CHAT domain-containing protein, partial [Kofleriaceae bacterium]
VDASFLMLSPDSDGHYALTAAAIRRQPLYRHPIVILAACHAAATAPYRHEAWSLPAAFVAAGARAVIASTDVIDDEAAGAFFDDVRARIERGTSPAIALRDARAAWLAAHPDAAWVRSLMVFQ